MDERACSIHVLAPRAAGTAVLVRDGTDGLSLPVVTLPIEAGATTGLMIEGIVAAGEGFATVVNLQALDDDDMTSLALAETEALHEAPPGFAWAPVAPITDAATPPLADALRRRAVALTDPPGAVAAPWFRPGWRDDLCAWAATHLAAQGRPITGPAEVVHVGPIAAVLRLPTHAGPTYLKASIALFAREAPIAAALARRTPGWVPEVLAADTAFGTLMADMRATVLGEEADATWAAGLRRHAEIQLAWAGAGPALLAADAQDRRLGGLAAMIDGLEPVHDRLLVAEPGAWPAWSEVVGTLHERCASLAASGLPDTLIHGDLHPGNIAMRDGEPLVFDWSDGALSHPFVDLTCFLRRVEDPSARRTMVTAYLEPWAAGFAMDRLLATVDDALVAGGLHQVVSYEALVPAMDRRDQWQFANAAWRWLRFAIRPLELAPVR